MTPWTSIPEPVRNAIECRTGPVNQAEDITTGRNNDLATVLNRTGRSAVFVKGVRGISHRMRWLRNEITSERLTAGLAPKVLFHADVKADDDWLVVGFEFVPGRPADLSPGSPDLPLVATALEELSTRPALDAKPLRRRWSVTNWWGKLADEYPDQTAGWDVELLDAWNRLAPGKVDGDRLLHTDLHPEHFRIAPNGSTRIIDWSWPASGAAWTDSAYLVIRLMDEGHSAADAESWARSLECFSGADDEALNAFAAHVSGLWTYRAATGAVPPGLAEVARTYATWRLRAAESSGSEAARPTRSTTSR